MDRSAMLESILERYRSCYDIRRVEDSENGLAAVCEYHEHDTGYALIRRAEMWSADRHEYVWFYSVPRLTASVYDECYAEAFNAGMERVDPKSGHMSSAVVVIFLADTADEEALDKVRRCRYRKDFKFTLNGWVVVRTACAAMDTQTAVSNSDGRIDRKFLSSVMHPKVRKKGRVGTFVGLLKKALK